MGGGEKVQELRVRVGNRVGVRVGVRVESLFVYLKVSSRMNISQALANSTGASAEIMRTSSSLFIILLMRAKGRSLCVLKSFVVVAIDS